MSLPPHLTHVAPALLPDRALCHHQHHWPDLLPLPPRSSDGRTDGGPQSALCAGGAKVSLSLSKQNTHANEPSESVSLSTTYNTCAR